MTNKNFIISLFIIFTIGCTSDTTDKNKNSTNSKKENNENIIEKSFQIDTENSQIKWIGKKITSSHDGIVNVANGKIIMEWTKVTSAEIIVDMTTIQNTDIESEEYSNKLTRHLKNEDFFNVEEFPISSIIIKNSEKRGESNYRYFGDLNIKGIINPVEFDGHITQIEDKYSVNINLSFDRTLWEIQYGSDKFFENLGDRMIMDNIDLEITLVTK